MFDTRSGFFALPVGKSADEGSGRREGGRR